MSGNEGLRIITVRYRNWRKRFFIGVDETNYLRLSEAFKEIDKFGDMSNLQQASIREFFEGVKKIFAKYGFPLVDH